MSGSIMTTGLAVGPRDRRRPLRRPGAPGDGRAATAARKLCAIGSGEFDHRRGYGRRRPSARPRPADARRALRSIMMRECPGSSSPKRKTRIGSLDQGLTGFRRQADGLRVSDLEIDFAEGRRRPDPVGQHERLVGTLRPKSTDSSKDEARPGWRRGDRHGTVTAVADPQEVGFQAAGGRPRAPVSPPRIAAPPAAPIGEDQRRDSEAIESVEAATLSKS